MSASAYTNQYSSASKGGLAAPSAYRGVTESGEKARTTPIPRPGLATSAETSTPVPVSVPAPPKEPEPSRISAAEQGTAPVPAAAPVWRIIGEAFHAYVIVECDDKLLLIDKHAAHERVLFEELRARMRERTDATQILMLPMQISLSVEDVGLLEAYRAEVEAIGFAFTAKSHAVSVSEIPEGLEPAAAAELLTSLPVTLAEENGSAALSRDILFEKALYQGACKAAIKAGREYPPEHIEWLCKKLMALPDITVCPHGRPVAMELSHAAIDRQFKRT